jgi:hypothetical protein
MYGPIDIAIADGIAIEKDNSIYVVDSGIEDGLVEFGVREKIIISDANLREAKLEKINDRAVSNGFSSSEISGRIKRSPDNGGGSSVQRELQKELSDNTGKSENNESGIFEKDATDGSRRLKFSLKDSDGNVEKESLSGQIAISKDNIEDVIETLLSPDSVEHSDSNGQIGILFKKNIGGKITAITILSEKKKALTLKSAWIIKNKQHISPTTDEKSPVSTSITGWSMNAVSNNSIRNSEENINTNSEENVNTNSKNFNVFNRKLKIVDFKFLLC